jgi:hypothetical protein
VELVVGLALAGLMAAAAHGALAAGQRAQHWQAAQAERSAVLRTAAAILPGELRGLTATEPGGSDLLALSPTAISYKALRALLVLCRRPTETGAGSGILVVAETPRWGARRVDHRRDSLLIFAEGDPTTPDDDHWVRGSLARAPRRGRCVGGEPGVALFVRHAASTPGLLEIGPGAPVYAQDVLRLEAYADGGGEWWLGARQRAPGRGWGRIQPVLGPLAAGGFHVEYYDRSGRPAGTPEDVARIDIRLVVGADGPPGWGRGGPRRARDTLLLSMALRGNRRGPSPELLWSRGPAAR